jgi:hypothetical protein
MVANSIDESTFNQIASKPVTMLVYISAQVANLRLDMEF